MKNITIHINKSIKNSVGIVPVFSIDDLHLVLPENQIEELSKSLSILVTDFEKPSLHVIHHQSSNYLYVFCFLGRKEKCSTELYRKQLGKGLKQAEKFQKKSIDIHLDTLAHHFSNFELWQRITAETAPLALYQFTKYKSDAIPINIKEIQLLSKLNSLNEAIVNEGHILGECTLLARDLVNEPAAYLYPESLAAQVVSLGKKYNFEVSILDDKECEALDMKAFLAVGRASNHPPRLIVMRLKNGGDETPIGLIGKGVTYDTGGLSLKPTSSMFHMKSDMSGAAITIAAITALARLKIAKNITAVVAACENVVAANAYKPGDIIGSMAGKTIEINNTDAEGRLTLADAIHYAISKENVNCIIDSATLTGAVKVALGQHVAGVVSTSDELANHLMKAAEQTDEKFWQLPIDEVYREMNKSDFADIANTGTAGLAGTITAAAFVEFFTQNLPWIHLDIAGVSFKKEEHDYISKGGTGFGTRTLYYMLKEL